MQTKVGIVFETATGELRRFIVPDEDEQLVAHSSVLPDETFLIENHVGTPSLDWVNNVVKKIS